MDLCILLFTVLWDLNRKNLRTFGDHHSYSFYERRWGLGQRNPRGRSHRSVHVNLNNKNILNIIYMHPLFTLLALALVCLQNFWSTHHFSHIINCKTEGIKIICGPENSRHTSWIVLQGCNLTLLPAFCFLAHVLFILDQTQENLTTRMTNTSICKEASIGCFHHRLSPILQI